MDDPRKLTMLSLLMISLMLFCRGYLLCVALEEKFRWVCVAIRSLIPSSSNV